MNRLYYGDNLGGLSLVNAIDLRRIEVAARIAADPARQARFGQFLTPAPIARFMAGMLSRPHRKSVRILDPGAGTGILGAAAVAHLCDQPEGGRPEAIHVTAWEVDRAVIPELHDALCICSSACEGLGIVFDADVREGDFILEGSGELSDDPFGASPYNIAILNPPYRKLRSDTPERAALRGAGIETSNLYAAFVWLALKLLDDGGELVAITPRSFMNGSYFRSFRAMLCRSLSFRRIHVYGSRSAAFAEDSVLQENVIFHGKKGGAHVPVSVTASDGPDDFGVAGRMANPDELVTPGDPDHILHVVLDKTGAQINSWASSLPLALADLGVSVSTGRVVDFRVRERLRETAGEDDVPLVFPSHLLEGFVIWPKPGGRKPNGLAPDGERDPLPMPAGWYVVVKRFTAKEERRRIVAALFDPGRVGATSVAFDNKLNVLHQHGGGLAAKLAKGLAVFLNSTAVDLYFRQFSGHTQVNAGDLRSLRFPKRRTLERLGAHIAGGMPGQDTIDQLVREEIPMPEGGDPVEARRRIEETLNVLKELDAPRSQRNERSALTLLGLLDLGPARSWEDARAPLRGVTELMGWMAEEYGKAYAPNTRETIRRYTLHQFMEMGLVLFNPDEPTRPTNSPNNAYQIEPSALEVLRTFGSRSWDEEREKYLASVAGKNRLRQEAREMRRIPVTLPGGQRLELTPGGQNVLVREILEQFAPRFTPGGHVIYVGDTSEKYLLFDETHLARLGVEIESHGRIPDVVIHHMEPDWLILIEAVTSHGPVNILRHNQLRDLFGDSRSGLVFVTAFLDRAAMREYLPEIAWETEVWVADAPDHLIHFNGERFLGPYREG